MKDIAPYLSRLVAGKRRGSLALALAITSILAVAACGGGKSGPASQSVSAAEVLRQSSLAMAEVSTFRFSLQSEGGDTPIPGGLGLSSASGVMARPDGVDVTVKARFTGFVVEVRVINAGGMTFMTNPLTGGWQRFEGTLSPLAFFDPARGVALVLQSVEAPAVVSNEALAGVDTYHIRGRLPASAVQFITGSYVDGSVLDSDLWIGRDDSRLRQVRLKGRITQEEADGLVRVLGFSQFGEPVNIQPPG